MINARAGGFALLAFLVHSVGVHAAPLVRPTIDAPSASTNTLVRLQQDACYTWGAPVVQRVDNRFDITQTVAPRTPCAGTPSSIQVVLPVLPAGAYRLTYRAIASGMPAIPDYSQEFAVSEFAPRLLRIFPANPVALEQVTANFAITDVCEIVTGVKLVDGGLQIVVRADFSDPSSCDAIAEVNVSLGSFTPGTYSIAIVRPPSEGGQELSRSQFTVSPTTLGVVRNPWQDLSGLWTATDEEPNTAIAIIHTLDRDPAGLLRDALVGVWYTYDAAGRPTWLYIEANTDLAAFGSRFGGTVSEYRTTNPGAAHFERGVAGEQVGTFQLRLSDENNPSRITGTIRGEPFDIRIERFRWTRSAWPPPRNAPQAPSPARAGAE